MRKRRFLKFIANWATPSEISTNLKDWEFKNKILRLTGLTIGSDTAISTGFQCLTGLEENITIGSHVSFGHNVKLYNFNRITIDSYCMLASDVTLTNGGHDNNSLEPFSGEIYIGKGSWLGHGTRIVKPVKIGNNCIIGAGSLVISDIPDNSIAVGTPAKIIKQRALPDEVWCLGNIYFNPHTFEIIKKNKNSELVCHF